MWRLFKAPVGEDGFTIIPETKEVFKHKQISQVQLKLHQLSRDDNNNTYWIAQIASKNNEI